MTEELLHHIWKFRLFNNSELKTEEGEQIEIIKVGDHNTNAGPDFTNARIKIGTTLWAGNVEIHINSSDWSRHRHKNDKAYDNIILHVVYNNDEKITDPREQVYPTLILNDKIDIAIFAKYNSFKTSRSWIPCANQVTTVSSVVLNGWLERLVIERMENKSAAILQELERNKNNWEETFYRQLAKNFGFKINAEPFLLLAKSLPLVTIAKHKDNLLQIEALLLGQAGFLNEHFSDKYLIQLQNEYLFLQKKFKLKPLEKHLWKFLRLRPANFPTIRISQFANLIYNSKHLFSKILEAKAINDIANFFKVSSSEFWNTHYTFEKQSPYNIKSLGNDTINNIIINTVVPFLFAYGKFKKEDEYINRAMQFLEGLGEESNSIVTKWKEIGIKPHSAFQTQALLQLKNEYCSNKKCLECAVGAKLLSLK